MSGLGLPPDRTGALMASLDQQLTMSGAFGLLLPRFPVNAFHAVGMAISDPFPILGATGSVAVSIVKPGRARFFAVCQRREGVTREERRKYWHGLMIVQEVRGMIPVEIGPGFRIVINYQLEPGNA